MDFDWASVGDWIETDVTIPLPNKLFARLDTREACAFGNELITSGRWRKHQPCDKPRCPACNPTK